MLISFFSINQRYLKQNSTYLLDLSYQNAFPQTFLRKNIQNLYTLDYKKRLHCCHVFTVIPYFRNTCTRICLNFYEYTFNKIVIKWIKTDRTVAMFIHTSTLLKKHMHLVEFLPQRFSIQFSQRKMQKRVISYF